MWNMNSLILILVLAGEKQVTQFKKKPVKCESDSLTEASVPTLDCMCLSAETPYLRIDFRNLFTLLERQPVEQLKDYLRDFNVTKQLTRSQTTEDFGFKLPETKRHNKHTSCTENLYVNNPPRRLADRVPQCSANGTTEMRGSYKHPEVPARLVTQKEQFKHPHSWMNQLQEPSWHDPVEPLDTTHEGFEKYLDPYLTTSRLHHRPYTAEQLARPSNTKDMVTYYTYADVPWAWGPKPKVGEWRLPLSRPKSMYDREKFKEDFREIRTHNKLRWVPGTFRTESRDNYVQQTSRPESQIHNYEEEVREFYGSALAQLKTNDHLEYSTFRRYVPESSHIGSGKPVCSVLDQFREKNKRLERKSNKLYKLKAEKKYL